MDEYVSPVKWSGLSVAQQKIIQSRFYDLDRTKISISSLFTKLDGTCELHVAGPFALTEISKLLTKLASDLIPPPTGGDKTISLDKAYVTTKDDLITKGK